MRAGTKHNIFSRIMMADAKTGAGNPRARRVTQYSLAGERLATYDCIEDAGRALGLRTHAWGISKCCRGIARTAYHYRWRYEDAA